jgi:pyruvate formate lyase activating enzyme
MRNDVATLRKENLMTDKEKDLVGLVFDIQGHSVHDGPGTRTTVFFSGCPLRCTWCCNPEGLFNQPVVMYKESKCVKCGRCVQACPYGAISVENGKLIHDRDICNKCKTYECVNACLNEGVSLSSQFYSVDELMKIFQRDRQFWGSRGGVTFSGGEPLYQKEFILTMLKECKKAFMHTCIETTACVSTNYFMEAASYVDWVFVDIRLILKNIERLAHKDDWEGFIAVRIPIIPGLNDSKWNIRETARFVKRIGLDMINILPFHKLGESKYRQVGQEYKLNDIPTPSDARMRELQQIIVDEELYCFVGHETPF